MPKKPLLTWRRARLCLATATALLTLAAFAGLGGTFLMRLQAVPALLRLLAAHAWGAAATLAAIVLTTALLGRLYCAAVCPLGVLQDLLGWLGHRLRHVLAGLALGILAAGYDHFRRKNGHAVYEVLGSKLCKVVAPEGTIIELRDTAEL